MNDICTFPHLKDLVMQKLHLWPPMHILINRWILSLGQHLYWSTLTDYVFKQLFPLSLRVQIDIFLVLFMLTWYLSLVVLLIAFLSVLSWKQWVISNGKVIIKSCLLRVFLLLSIKHSVKDSLSFSQNCLNTYGSIILH